MTADRSGETDESPLRRWSRRKHAAQQRTAEPEEHAPAPEAGPSEEAAAAPEAPEAPEASDDPAAGAATETETTDADVPAIESLTPDSDFSQFMSPKVSDSLRQTALRKLFGLAQFNVRDGLDDYDEDYTQFRSLGETVTADMRYHAERRAARAREQDEPSELADEAAPRPAEPDHGIPDDEPAAPDAPEARTASADPEDDPDDDA